MTATKLLLAIMLLSVAVLSPSLAQDDEVLPGCDDETIEEMDKQIQLSAVGLSLVLSNPPDEVYEVIDDIALQQRAFWNWVIFAPDCLEVYTVGYRFGRVLDEYAVGVGVALAGQVARGAGDDRAADGLADDAEKHLREAYRILESDFPEQFELLNPT